ncbi:MAG: ThuA domain-containing protein, partial [Planctomycetes bacterium]|nr:ThuA domain-containing protein [Planctomycetota bacterium]
IVDGQNNHNWRATTLVLKSTLEGCGLFTVDVSTSPGGRNLQGWNPEFSKYDVVVSNYNGTLWPENVRAAFLKYVKRGGGVVVVHAANNAFAGWKEYNDMMGGAFVGHPWHTEVPVRLLDDMHPLNKVFGGKGFTVRDEIYQFRDDTALPSDRRMLLSLDPKWNQLGKGSRKDGFYAVSWISSYGKGRTFYCSLGHRNEIYYNPAVLEHYLAGFQYVLGDLMADDQPLEIK